MTPNTGTLIHGTHRNADLIPAFLAELERLDPNGHAGYLDGLEADNYDPDVLLGLDDEHEFWDTTDATEITHELFDLLDAHAPAGHYFGAHPGDGSDFGYWQTDDED